MDVFSFVDILFIGECPRSVEGLHIALDNVNMELFSFVQGSGVEVFIKAEVCGMFQVVEHNVWGCIVSFVKRGMEKKFTGCYVHPDMRAGERQLLSTWLGNTSMAMGDFNCKHPRWASPGETISRSSMVKGKWLSDTIDHYRWDVYVPGNFTFDNSSTIDLCIGERLALKVEYVDKAGLQHMAILARLTVDECSNMVQVRPHLGRITRDTMKEALERVEKNKDCDLWTSMVDEVRAFKRKRRSARNVVFWNEELDRLRKDTANARKHIPDQGRECYHLVRRVYRAMILSARRASIRKTIDKAGDPAIFKLARNLLSRRTLPAMVDGDHLVSTHDGISDLIAEQIKSGPKQIWKEEQICIGPIDEIGLAIRRSPINTGPGMDNMGYPFIRLWWKFKPNLLQRLIEYGLRHGTQGWHIHHTVLIEKADKP